jgi:di/tricarboxylate transporter
MTIIAMFVLLVREIYDPLKVFVVAITVFLVAGYIDIDEVVSGFSNKGVLAVAVLFIIAGAVENSSYFQEITKFNNLDREGFNPLKLFVMITGLSAFLNNTPIVSIFIPITKRISSKTGISASKLLIPISYLSILGGILTLIGTSTNLIVSGLMEEMGLEPLSFFELTKISLPAAILGIIYIYFFHEKRLPDNSQALEQSRKQTNEHIVRFVVEDQATIIGKTIKEANLRALTGVYLVEVERNGSRIFPITPAEIIRKDDILVFAGQTDQIDELRSIDHLVLETERDINSNYFNHDNTIILEAVVTQYLGKPNHTIKELKFREKYNAVVIGIIRNGERLQGKLGSIKPKLGDILLLIADKSTTGFIEKDPAITIISSERRRIKEHTKASYYPFVSFLGVVLFAIIFNLNILHTALIGVAFMLITNTIQIKETLNMIEYKTIILIASSFAVGKALTNTGTAAFIADTLEPFIGGVHPMLLLMLVFLITNFFTTIITNNAAAILSLPIVYEIASLTPYSIRPFLLVTAISASSAFLSPYGYQTNTMVYGVGGYHFRDFVKFGYPLTVIMMIMSALGAYLWYF